MKYFKNQKLKKIYLQRIENLFDRWIRIKLELQLGIESLKFISSQFTYFQDKEYVKEYMRDMKRINDVLEIILKDIGKQYLIAKKAGLQKRKEILKYLQEHLKELEEWKRKRRLMSVQKVESTNTMD